MEASFIQQFGNTLNFHPHFHLIVADGVFSTEGEQLLFHEAIAETPSRTPGPTRGASNVLEWNPKTGNVRGWYECYDVSGKVNRVHPKNINGQIITSPHYPPISTELMR